MRAKLTILSNLGSFSDFKLRKMKIMSANPPNEINPDLNLSDYKITNKDASGLLLQF